MDKPKVEFKSDDRHKIKRMMSDYTSLVAQGKDKDAKRLMQGIHSEVKNMKPR
jgi:hypothetical protein